MPVVDLGFRLQGRAIPADHGYELYGAVSRIAEWAHKPTQNKLGIHPINGLLAGNRMLHLTSRSRLTFRLDSDNIRELLPLAGNELDLDGHKLRVGVPTVYALRPRAALHSRLVTIKHRMEPQAFLEAVQAELTKLNIKAQPGLIKRRNATPLEGRRNHHQGHEGATSGRDLLSSIPSPLKGEGKGEGERPAPRAAFIRRTLRIHDKEVVGYAVIVQGLTAGESLRLQEHGIGGRRRFGCGIFVPVR